MSVRFRVLPFESGPQENHQADEWGYVEGGHDIDDADFRVRRAEFLGQRSRRGLSSDAPERTLRAPVRCFPTPGRLAAPAVFLQMLRDAREQRGAGEGPVAAAESRLGGAPASGAPLYERAS